MIGTITGDRVGRRATLEHARALATLVWTGEDVRFGSMLAAGAAVWVLYSVLQVVVNGMVFDEIVIPAQIVTGAVQYPPGHPHGMYFPRLFNLQNYLAALVWMVLPSPVVFSVLGNVLFVFASTFVPFAVTLLLTRRPWWGHVTATLILTETATRFNGSYLLFVFPHFSTHGHLGIHFALVIPVLVAAGLWRSGAFCLGLLPAIHIAMAAVVWPWAAVYLWWKRDRLRGESGRGIGKAFVAGLATCVVLAVAVRWRSEARLVAPYDTPFDAELIYRVFERTTDGHRQPFSGPSFAYLVSPVILAVMGFLLVRNRRDDPRPAADDEREAACWMSLFGAIVWAAVYGAWIITVTFGGLPRLIDMTMPFRLSNLSAMMLMPFTVALIASVWDRLTHPRRTAVLLLVAALVSGAGLLRAADRHVAFAHVMYVVLGLAVALDIYAGHSARGGRLPSIGASALIAVTLALMYFSIGTLVWMPFAISALGFLVVLILIGWRNGFIRSPSLSRLGQVALVGGCVTGMALSTPGPYVPNSWEETAGRWSVESSFDRALNDWLRENTAPNEMLLVAMWPRSIFQVVTGHPVMADIDTLMMIAYMKDLAPPVNLIVRDLYGIDYTNDDQMKRIVNPDGMLRPTSSVWLDAWKTRTQTEWQRLGQKYGFRLVIAPKSVALDLPAALRGSVWTLHVIPGRT